MKIKSMSPERKEYETELIQITFKDNVYWIEDRQDELKLLKTKGERLVIKPEHTMGINFK